MDNQEMQTEFTMDQIGLMLRDILASTEHIENRFQAVEQKLEEHEKLLYKSETRLSLLEGEEDFEQG